MVGAFFVRREFIVRYAMLDVPRMALAGRDLDRYSFVIEAGMDAEPPGTSQDKAAPRSTTTDPPVAAGAIKIRLFDVLRVWGITSLR
jgi:hypothetical protein